MAGHRSQWASQRRRRMLALAASQSLPEPIYVPAIPTPAEREAQAFWAATQFADESQDSAASTGSTAESRLPSRSQAANSAVDHAGTWQTGSTSTSLLVAEPPALTADAGQPSFAATSPPPNDSLADDSSAAAPAVSALSAVRHLLTREAPNIWMFLGDQATLGLEAENGLRSWADALSERVRWELRRLQDAVVNGGRTGATAESLLREFPSRWSLFRPSMVFVSVGVNDALEARGGVEAFYDRLCELTQQIRDLHAVPVLQTPFIVANQDRLPVRLLQTYAQAVVAAGRDSGVAVIDQFHDSRLAVQRGEAGLWWDRQGMWPSLAGHRQMTSLIFHELDLFDRQSELCRQLVTPRE